MSRLLLLVTDLEIGGTPTVVRELALRLKAAGKDVQVACLGGDGPVAAEIRQAGINATALHAKGVWDFAVFKRLGRFIDAGGFDTVFSFLVHANVAAALVARKRKQICWIQSIQTTQPRPRWHWLAQQWAAGRARQIVVPSPSVAQRATAVCGINPSKIVTIPNAVNPADFPQSTQPGRDTRPFPIGFIGRLDPVKGLPTLLSVMPSMRNRVHLHIFGQGQQQKYLESVIAVSNLSDAVTLHGAIARPQVALQRIGMLILPSFAEGFGLVLIEAMAAGVPVIGRDAPGIRDVIEHEKNGLLFGQGYLPLDQTIDRLLGDRSLQQRLIEGGHASVTARYTWEAVLPAYLQLLEQGSNV